VTYGLNSFSCVNVVPIGGLDNTDFVLYIFNKGYFCQVFVMLLIYFIFVLSICYVLVPVDQEQPTGARQVFFGGPAKICTVDAR
jgi:hypothetical protein